jgi:hypothetical protein
MLLAIPAPKVCVDLPCPGNVPRFPQEKKLVRSRTKSMSAVVDDANTLAAIGLVISVSCSSGGNRKLGGSPRALKVRGWLSAA